MFRPITPADTETLITLTARTGYFKPVEIETLRDVLQEYHEKEHLKGHRAVAWEEEGRIIGYVYHAPREMTDRTWYLWWIAVDSTAQGRGLGSKLLAFVEADIRERNGRLLLVETATLPDYEPTRRFYIKHGYTLAATIQDYYADGDGMALFGKRLTS
jgi:ribosomal protein S18 acetylase RimI-like enzyme